MSTYKGTDGYLMEASTVIGELNHWTLTLTSASIDTGAFQGDGWGSFTPGLLTWTGTGSGFWSMDDTGQAALWTAATGNNSIELYFHTSDDYYYYGSANLTSIAIDDTLAGVATVTFNFQGTGELHQKVS